MKRFSLSATFDALLTLIIGFLFCFIILNYFCPTPYSHAIALILSIALSSLACKVSYSRYLKRSNQTATTKEAKQVLNQLDFLTSAQISNLFLNAFTADGKEPVKRRGHFYLPQTKTLVFFSFGFKQKSKAEIVKAFNLLEDGERAIILGTEFPEEVKEFAMRFGGRVSLIYGQPVYSLLKKHDNLPEITPDIKLPDDAKKPLPKFFRRKNAKSFLTFGIILLLMSYFVPLKLYYIIMGGAMLIFGFILLLFGTVEHENNNP